MQNFERLQAILSDNPEGLTLLQAIRSDYDAAEETVKDYDAMFIEQTAKIKKLEEEKTDLKNEVSELERELAEEKNVLNEINGNGPICWDADNLMDRQLMEALGGVLTTHGTLKTLDLLNDLNR